jgi:hypothetical protein
MHWGGGGAGSTLPWKPSHPRGSKPTHEPWKQGVPASNKRYPHVLVRPACRVLLANSCTCPAWTVQEDTTAGSQLQAIHNQTSRSLDSHTALSWLDHLVAVDSHNTSQTVVDLEFSKQVQDRHQNNLEGLPTVDTHIQALRHVSHVAVTMLLISKKNCCPPQ